MKLGRGVSDGREKKKEADKQENVRIYEDKYVYKESWVETKIVVVIKKEKNWEGVEGMMDFGPKYGGPDPQREVPSCNHLIFSDRDQKQNEKQWQI
jgi:hypothetical protein